MTWYLCLLNNLSCVLVINGAAVLGVLLAVLFIYFTTLNSLLNSKGYRGYFPLYLLHSLNIFFYKGNVKPFGILP